MDKRELIEYIRKSSVLDFYEAVLLVEEAGCFESDTIKEVFDKYYINGLRALRVININGVNNTDIVDLFNMYGQAAAETLVYLQDKEKEK